MLHKVIDHHDATPDTLVKMTSDKEWRARYHDLAATSRSKVVESRRRSKDFMDFPNPMRREMNAAWRLPDGYDYEQVKEAFLPLTVFVPKAMQLHKDGKSVKALGVCFDLFDMLVVMYERDFNFFIGSDDKIMHSMRLKDATLYAICTIFKDEKLPLDAKAEILSRLQDYNEITDILHTNNDFGQFKPINVIREYGNHYRELQYNDFYGIEAYKWHKEKNRIKLDERQNAKKNEDKNIAISRKITDSDWLSLHPYGEMMPVDKQYLAFANSLLSYLDNGTIGVPYEKRRPLALTLTCYVEDKRSRLRLFSSFVAAFRQKKEYIHPIQQLIKSLTKGQLDTLMAEYSPTKINAIDLCYFLLLYHDFSKLKTEEKIALGSRLCNVLQNLGSDKLQRSTLYADERCNLLLEGWHGFKKFLLWVANGPHYLWGKEEKVTVATILGDKFTLSNGINPLYFTLTYARKSKVGSDIVTAIEKLKVLPLTRYDVLDDDFCDEYNRLTTKDRKKKHFLLKRTGTSHTSKKYPVIYDEISTRKYIVGETYKCQLAHYGNDWYLLAPAIILNPDNINL